MRPALALGMIEDKRKRTGRRKGERGNGRRKAAVAETKLRWRGTSGNDEEQAAMKWDKLRRRKLWKKTNGFGE